MGRIVIDPLVAGRRVPSSDRLTLASVRGERLADVGVAPRLAAQAALNEIRGNANGIAPGEGVFHEAVRLFATADLDGETVEQYIQNVILGTGLPTSTVQRAITDLVSEINSLSQTTRAELPPTEFGMGRSTRWVPAGRVFAAVMASNHPVPNAAWVQALFHGYSVLVRPGSRDPFTARRLVAALLRAGLAPQKLAFVPCSHSVGNFLLDQSDRGIIYGGERAVQTWQRSDSVAVRGPGRTKALIDVEPTNEVLDYLTESAAFDGGTRCTNLSAVLTTRPVADLANQLAKRMSELTTSSLDPSSTLPVVDRQRASTIRRQLARLRTELTDHTAAWHGQDCVLELNDGSFLPRPVVLSTDRADDPAIGTELPFPFVVVAPWSESNGMTPLRHSLVLNLLTERADLVEESVREPTVRKVTLGMVPSWTVVPGIPHDGNYTHFLLEPKGVLTEASRSAHLPKSPASTGTAPTSLHFIDWEPRNVKRDLEHDGITRR